MLGGCEEARADSTVGRTTSALPEHQRRRWAFIASRKIAIGCSLEPLS